MNFFSTLNELDRLYEAEEQKVVRSSRKLKESTEKSRKPCAKGDCLKEADEVILVDDEPIVDDEAVVEEPVEADDKEIVDVNDYVLECSKCGALVIKAIKEVTEDEESGLANVGEECAYCEASDGFKILGTFAPYEEGASEEDSNDEETIEIIADEETIEEALITEGKVKDNIKKIATRLGADGATIVRCFAELISELINNDTLYDAAEYVENKAVLKALQNGNDKVLNTTTKDEIEDLIADIEEYKKAKATKKANSSDEELEELFNANVNIDAKDFAGSNNNVSVLGLGESLDEEELEELFDANVSLDARGFGGSGNDVSVLSTGLGESLDDEEDEELEELFNANLDIDARGFGGTGNTVGVL